MDDDWFYMIRDEVRGPMTADQLRNAAIKGLVQPDTNVRKGTNGDWVRATKVKNLLPSDAGAPPATPPPAKPPKPSPVRIPKRDAGPEPELESDAQVNPVVESETPAPRLGPTVPSPKKPRKKKPQALPELPGPPEDEWGDEDEELPFLDAGRETISGPLKSRRSRHRASPIPVLVVALVGIGLLLGLLYFLSQS